MMNTHLIPRAALLAVVMTLGACASWNPPPDDTAGFYQDLASRHPDLQLTGEQHDTRVAQLLDQPLTPNAATQLMLLNAPRIEMLLAELGIANARRAQAGLIANPHFAIGALRPEGGGRWQLDMGISQSLLDLLTRSLRMELADVALTQRQLELQRRLDEAIHELQSAYFAALAAQAQWRIHQRRQQASEAAYTLAQRMRTAGNLSPSEFLHHQVTAQQINSEIRQARLAADTTRLRLAYLLGLRPQETLTLPEQLPGMPAEYFAAADLLAQAQQHRADLALVRQQQALLARQGPLINRSRWADISLGINAEREFDGAVNAGPEVEFGLPLFDRGQAKLAALDAKKDVARAQEEHLLRKIEHDITLALRQLDDARAAYEEVIALQQTAQAQLDESQREVNFMLASPFDLLTLKQQEIHLAADRIEAIKHYWQARTALSLAVGTSLAIGKRPAITDTPDPMTPTPATPDEHHHHGDHHHD